MTDSLVHKSGTGADLLASEMLVSAPDSRLDRSGANRLLVMIFF